MTRSVTEAAMSDTTAAARAVARRGLELGSAHAARSATSMRMPESARLLAQATVRRAMSYWMRCPNCNATGQEHVRSGGMYAGAVRCKLCNGERYVTVREGDASDMTIEKLLSTDDAQVWAREFVALHGGDEGLMIGWFANAIETAKRIERERYGDNHD